MEITEDHPTEQSPTHQERIKQRAERKKKAGSLPLRMFLSMDDDAPNPKCVHSSNPFHKCSNSCYRRAASMPGKPGDGKKIEGLDGQSKCRHASNPFHVCSDSCRQRIAQHDGGVGSSTKKIFGKGASDKVVNVRPGVNPSCIHASNPFHTCTESCFRKIAAKDGVKGVDGIAKQGNDHQSKCSYASNPFHICIDSCTKIIAPKDGVRGAVGTAKQGVDNKSKCTYASNPFHTCGESCLGRKTGRDPVKTGGTRVVKEERREVPKIVEKESIHLKPEEASEANKTSEEDSIEVTHEPDFLFFLRGFPSSRREQEENAEHSDNEEVGEADESSKKRQQVKKTSLGDRRSDKKEKRPRTSPMMVPLKSVNSPAKSPSTKHQAEESNDTGEKVFSRKRKAVDAPAMKSGSKPDNKERVTGNRSSTGKVASEEDKQSRPSKDELRVTICEILKGINFNTATFNDMVKLLSKSYKTDLTPRKSVIKKMIKEELTKLAEEAADEEEDAAAADDDEEIDAMEI